MRKLKERVNVRECSFVSERENSCASDREIPYESMEHMKNA